MKLTSLGRLCQDARAATPISQRLWTRLSRTGRVSVGYFASVDLDDSRVDWRKATSTAWLDLLIDTPDLPGGNRVLYMDALDR